MSEEAPGNGTLMRLIYGASERLKESVSGLVGRVDRQEMRSDEHERRLAKVEREMVGALADIKYLQDTDVELKKADDELKAADQAQNVNVDKRSDIRRMWVFQILGFLVLLGVALIPIFFGGK